MQTPKSPVAKYVQVDLSPARLDRVWSRVAERLPAQPTPARSWFARTALVLAVAGTATAGIVLIPRMASSPTRSALHGAVLQTATDALNVDLEDGSRLELSANTRVENVDAANTEVALRLERGQVTCDLVPRKDRRFSVFAAGVEVRVTGTRFGVTFDPDSQRVSVEVQRGSVEVLAPDGSQPKRRLTAGERWSIDLRTARREPEPATEPAAALNSAPVAAEAPSARTPEPRAAVVDPAPTEAEAPPSAAAWLDRANTARRAGDSAGAARAYESLLAKFPKDARAGLAAFELGRLRLGPLSDVNGAAQAFRRAIALAPGSAFRQDAMARLVEAYAAAGKLESCASAKAAYLKDYPQGVHAAFVSRQCGTH